MGNCLGNWLDGVVTDPDIPDSFPGDRGTIRPRPVKEASRIVKVVDVAYSVGQGVPEQQSGRGGRFGDL